ncbi:MAG TPA: DNA-directed RNA polymerase subunit alpha C-terminal domain-containing protein, partial [Chloroflexota bacterium]|nr:DNA-directed RNA polymerase subunit alpha C-terminal domain-containing protein [Chloroflexota bacterium]
RAGITKVGQILEMSEDDLLGVRNFGHKSLDELRERLAAHGILEHSRLGETGSAEGATTDEDGGASSTTGGDGVVFDDDDEEFEDEYSDDEFDDDYDEEEE